MTGRAVKLTALVAALGIVAALGVSAYGYLKFTSPGPLREPVAIVLPKGAGLAQIAEELAGAGVIEHPLVFRIGVRLSGVARQLKAGEYNFAAGTRPHAVMTLLISGKTVVRRLTIAEGLTGAQVMALVRDAEGLDGDVPSAPEGMLLPETYHYSWGDTRQQLVDRMRRSMESILADLWPARTEGLPLDDPYQALILASIVEKETAVPEERPHIAGVFINRLQRGMRLQSDPTVAYGLGVDGVPLSRPLTRQDLKSLSPFNTYVIKGLPPHPIANPGRASIAAVLMPLPTKDLYFVADGSGGHAFAETLAQHNRNVRKWRRVQSQANGN